MHLIGYAIKHRMGGVYLRGSAREGLRPEVRYYGPEISEAAIFKDVDDAKRAMNENETLVRIFEDPYEKV